MPKKAHKKQNTKPLTRSEKIRDMFCYILAMAVLFFIAYNLLYKRYVEGVLSGIDPILSQEYSGVPLKRALLFAKLKTFKPIATKFSPSISFMFSLILVGPIALLAGKVGRHLWNPFISVIFSVVFAGPVDYLHEVCLYYFSGHFIPLDLWVMQHIKTDYFTAVLIVYAIATLIAVIIPIFSQKKIKKHKLNGKVSAKKSTRKTKIPKPKKPYVEKYTNMWIEITYNGKTSRVDGKAIKRADRLIKKEIEKLHILEKECDDIKKVYHISENKNLYAYTGQK